MNIYFSFKALIYYSNWCTQL